jgi:hypothetical protein
MPITDDLFWSLFNGTLLDALHNESNCEQFSIGYAPVGIAMQATFLLETTTDFINEPETESPTPLSPTKADSTPTEVTVDPFRFASPSEDVQKSSQSRNDIEPSPTNAPASSTIAEPTQTKTAPHRTTSVTKQSLEALVSPANQIDPSSKDNDEPESSESRSARPTVPADEVSRSQAAEITTVTNEISNPSDKPTSASKTSQFEILNSLIQNVGEHLSSAESTASAAKIAPTITFNGVTATPGSSSDYVFDEQTLEPGGPAITISGTRVSLASGASAIVVGSSTSVLLALASAGDRVQAGAVQSLLTFPGATATLNSASEYIIADQTLEPGGPAITVSGTPISLAPQATAVIIGSSTSILATTPNDQEQRIGKLASVLTLAGATATLNSASEYVVEGQTLTPGGSAITVSGTRISLAPHATAVVIGSTTSALAVTSTNIGDYIWAGIAGLLAAAKASSTNSPEAPETNSGSEVNITLTASDGEVVVKTMSTAETAPAEASETKSGSEVVVTSTASDGEVVVKTIFTADSTTSSPIAFSSSTGGASLLASGEAPSTSSSSSPSGTPDAASAASFTKSVVDVTALIFWMGVVTMFSM